MYSEPYENEARPCKYSLGLSGTMLTVFCTGSLARSAKLSWLWSLLAVAQEWQLHHFVHKLHANQLAPASMLSGKTGPSTRCYLLDDYGIRGAWGIEAQLGIPPDIPQAPGLD